MTRIVAHAHTTWSYDGKLTLADWRSLARQRGVDAVLFSEHEETGWTSERYTEYVARCREESAPDVALVPGIEFNQDGYHVLCFGLKAWPPRPGTAADLAAAVHAQGCLLALAHPARYGWSYPDSLLDAADAVEVWNSNWVCEGTLGPHPRSVALAQTKGKAMLIGQDVHKPKHLSPVLLETPSSDVLADLRRGHYQVRCGNRKWEPGQLGERWLAGALQRYRTSSVRTALRWYRSVRRTARRYLGSGTGR